MWNSISYFARYKSSHARRIATPKSVYKRINISSIHMSLLQALLFVFAGISLVTSQDEFGESKPLCPILLHVCNYILLICTSHTRSLSIITYVATCIVIVCVQAKKCGLNLSNITPDKSYKLHNVKEAILANMRS